MAWLLPELDVGLEPELRPPEPAEVDVGPDEVEPELELEVELDDPELVEEVPDEDDVVVLCVDPGRLRATAPVTATLAIATAVVVERTLARPCSLAAMARRMPSAGFLLMAPILGSGFLGSLDEASGFAMRGTARPEALSRTLSAQHEGRLKAGAAGDEHDPEGATLAFERQHAAALLEAARDQLAGVDTALGRLRAGRYGTCDRCGQPIGADRLAARPAALTCLACAARG